MGKTLYTAENLIKTVRLRGGLPDSGQTGTTDAEILQLLNEDMFSKLVPGVIKPKEEYLTRTIRQTIVSTQVRYRAPQRAVGQKWRTVFYIDPQGNRVSLPKFDRDDIDQRRTASGTSGPRGFYLEGNDVVLVPDAGTASISGSLEIAFFLRPGSIVKTDEVATIASIDTGAKTITFNETVPPTAFTATSKYDVHSRFSGGEVLLLELTGTDLTGNVLTVSEAIDGSTFGSKQPEVGDYVCLTGEAALPGLPIELHMPLALMTVVTILNTLDPEMAAVKQAELSQVLRLAGYYIDTRVEGRPSKIVSEIPMHRTGYRS